MKLFKRVKGFTLIETIIYSILLSIIISYSLGGVYTIIQDSDRLNTRVTTDAEANFLLKKIEWALSSAQLILLPLPGLTGSSLTLNRYSFPINPVIFDLNSGNLRMGYNLNTPIILNSDRVTVSNLSFEHISPLGARPFGVKTTMTINNRVYTMTIYQNK